MSGSNNHLDPDTTPAGGGSSGHTPRLAVSILTTPADAPETPLTTTRFAPPPAVVRPSPRLSARPPNSPMISGKSPRLSGKHGRSASGVRGGGGGGSGAPPTPILSHAHSPALPPNDIPVAPDQPEFAELLTPAQLQKRKRARVHGTLGTGLGTFAGLPVLEGPSRLGFTTHNGDLYRGAVVDPNAGQEAEEDNEDALSVSSRTSTSSSWSWGSGNLERGRRATMGVVRRVGEAIGVRRGSHTSHSSGDSTNSTDSDSDNDGATSRFSRFGRALTRTMSRAGTETSTDRPRRVYKPRRREFTLVLPPEPSTLTHSDKLPEFLPLDVSVPGTPAESERVITTPVLPPILEAIRAARAQSGHGGVGNEPVVASSHNVPIHNVPVRRGGSGPGRLRGAGAAPAHPFAPPPVPRPAITRGQTHTHTLSRVDALRSQAGTVVRPKSASDLLGLAATPKSASDLLGLAKSPTASTFGFDNDDGIPTQAPVLGPELTTIPSPTPTARDKPKACIPPWWLDVSCPNWKDLRDIGELLGLHPLTLEDVLHQDPREKLDTYDKLGYYFVVVRALDEQYFKYTPGSNTAPPGPPGSEFVPAKDSERRAASEAQKKDRRRSGWGFGRSTGHLARKTGEKVEIVEDNPGKEGIEGVGVGGVNMYLVVFSDGIVTVSRAGRNACRSQADPGSSTTTTLASTRRESSAAC